MDSEDLPQFMTLDEVSKRLKVPVRTLKKWINREEDPLPAVYLSDHTIRVPWDQFNIWLDGIVDKEAEK